MQSWSAAVYSPPEAATLPGLLARFAAALRAGAAADDAARDMASAIVDDGLDPERRLQIYRNNVQAMFDGALSRTFPVLKATLGDAAFESLAREYREAHPSRSGDLHWVGRVFADWLDERLAADDAHRWLTDLARLEWACEEALVARTFAPVGRNALAEVPAEQVADTGLDIQPAVRLVSSPHAIWSVWRAHQPGCDVESMRPAAGPQHVVVACTAGRLALRSVPREQAEFVRSLTDGATLREALDASDLPVAALPEVLEWLFEDGLVIAVRPAAGPTDATGSRA